MTAKTIAIAADHGGVELKSEIIKSLADSGQAERGILVCGSGIGMSIAANRFPQIRAALVHDRLSTELCRQHNNANVLCLGARLLGDATALDCVNAFVTTEFEGGRHERRVEKLSSVTD